MSAIHTFSPLTKALKMRRVFQPRLLSATLVLALPFAAQVQAQTFNFNIPAQPLANALQTFGQQANLQVLYSPDDVQSLRSRAVSGALTPQAGIEQLLTGSKLAYSLEGNTLTLSSRSATGALELGATRISGEGLGSVSENTGSYTTGSTSTATKMNLSLRETPQSISVMTRQRIDDQSLTTVNDVLAQTPGLNVQSLGSDRFYVYSRGYEIDNYQYDGMPTTIFSFTQSLPQDLMDLAVYDHIEVLRGASGLLTGAGDPSGTINFIRKRPTETFQGHVSAGAGSWDKYRTEADVSGPLIDSGKIRGRAVAAYQQGNSYLDALKQEKTSLYGVVEADLSDDTLLTFGVDYLHNDPKGYSTTGIPLFYSNGKQTNLSRSFNAASGDSTNRQDSTTTFASIEQKLAYDWSLKVSASYLYNTRDYDSRMLSTSRFANEQTGAGTRTAMTKGDATQKQKGFDVQLKGPFQLGGREHELMMGFNYQDYENHRQGANPLSGDRSPLNLYTWDNHTVEPVYGARGSYDDDRLKFRQNGTYAAVRLKPIDDLAVILGARVSNYKYDSSLDFKTPANAPYSTADTTKISGKVTPYAGIVYDLNENHSVYASYTSIFKPQTVRDRNGQTLSPRDGDNYELGLKSEYFNGRLNSAIAIYESKQDNLAVQDVGQSIPGTQNPAYKAVTGAKTRGVDMELSGEIMPDWNMNASYNHSVTKDADNERINTIIPSDMFKLWTTYKLSGDLERLTIGGGANWQSGIHFSAAPSLIGKTVKAKEDDYTVFNLMARYQLTKQWSGTVNVNNVFDKKYISSLDSNFYSMYYGDPRNVMFSTRYDF